MNTWALCAALLLAGAGEAAAGPTGRIIRVPGAGVVPTVGPADAPVTAHVFVTAGTAHAAGLDRVRELAARHPRRIRVEVRVLAAPGQVALPEAWLEAAAQGRFDAFEAATRTLGPSPTHAALLAAAASCGMDTAALAAAWADGRHARALAAHDGLRQRLGVRAGAVELALAGEPTPRPLARTDDEALEQLYQAAYARAREVLDDGVPRAHLDAALLAARARAQRPARPARGFVDARLRGPADDDADAATADDAGGPGRPLVGPLALRGWPRLGAVAATTTVIVACDLRGARCAEQLNYAGRAQARHGDAVALVWLPAFPLAATGAVGLYHDAARCAASAGVGWAWVEQAAARAAAEEEEVFDAADDGQRLATRADELGAAVGVPARDRWSCLAREAGASAAATATLWRAGVSASPTVIIGGIAYAGGLADARSTARLVDAAVAGGVLAAATQRRPR